MRLGRERRRVGARPRGAGHREADHPDDEPGVQRGQQQIAARVLDDDGAELETQSRLRDDADDDARSRAGRRNAERLQRRVVVSFIL